MKRFMNILIFIILKFELINQIKFVNAHGRLLEPPGRGSMWRYGFNVPPNYNDMSNYCGGFAHQWEKNKGKCGVCGDPYDQEPKEHEPGGKYATGIVGKTYKEGEKINITVEITASHYGYFEFRLCKNDEFNKKITQDCLNENLLEIIDNNLESNLTYDLNPDENKYKYFIPYKKNMNYNPIVQLPRGVVCKYCVLQWRYRAGNRFGKSANGVYCLGCAEEQEEFYNCADIEITLNSDKYETNINENIINTTVVSIVNKADSLNKKTIFIFIYYSFSRIMTFIYSY